MENNETKEVNTEVEPKSEVVVPAVPALEEPIAKEVESPVVDNKQKLNAELAEKPEQPKTITPVERTSPAPSKPVVKEKIMSGELLKPKADPNNAFQTRRAANSVATKHSMIGNRVLKLLDEYRARMAVPSNDRTENMRRINMLQNIVNTACPQTALDMQTATDIARIMFDEFMKHWGTVYRDETIFRLGNTLKGTAYDMDKMVMFIEAFVQMVEGAVEKKKVMFDEVRLQKVLKNNNVAIAMSRIRDNINTRNGFPVIAG